MIGGAGERTWERLRAALGGVALSVALASCSTASLDQIGFGERKVEDPAVAELPAAQRKEHERLIATYGGVYQAPELQALMSEPSRVWLRLPRNQNSNIGSRSLIRLRSMPSRAAGRFALRHARTDLACK